MFLAHASPAPSAWVRRFAPLIRARGSVLDVACGSGRHLRWLAERGFAVTGVDHDARALAALQGQAEIVLADLEAGPWPLARRCFDGIVVTNYLWRPLWPALRGALAVGGVLIYETFADGQQLIGKPSRPEFLLQAGELLGAFAGLRVVAFEDGFEDGLAADAARCVQRIVVVAEARPQAGTGPARYSLQGPAAKINESPGTRTE